MIEALLLAAASGTGLGLVHRAGAPRRRLALAYAAVVVAWLALLGPLDELAHRRLAAHMLQHVLVGDAVPLLLVLALRRDVLRALPGLAPALLRRATPAGALCFWAVSLGVWHVPAVYDAALRSAPLHAAEHCSFLLAGLLVWAQLLDAAGRGALDGWRRFGYGLAVLAGSQALANVLVLSYRPLYGTYGGIGDQDAAGVVMMVEQLLTLGGFLVLTARRLLARGAAAGPARHPLAA